MGTEVIDKGGTGLIAQSACALIAHLRVTAHSAQHSTQWQRNQHEGKTETLFDHAAIDVTHPAMNTTSPRIDPQNVIETQILCNTISTSFDTTRDIRQVTAVEKDQMGQSWRLQAVTYSVMRHPAL